MSDDLVGAVAEALNYSQPEDVIDGVKTAVRDELRELDPGVQIEDTHYFNHTYVPDFVVSWGKGHQRHQRAIFLRNSIASPSLKHDVENLEGSSPVLLALRPADGKEVQVPSSKRFNRAMRRAGRALVTDVGVVESISGDREAGARSPLAPILGSGLLRGGRGYLDRGKAEVLQAAARPADDEAPELSGEFFETVQQHFAPESAVQLSRAASILRMAFASDFVGPVGAEQRPMLSDEEIQAILPFVLASPNATENSDFWTYLGSMISLQKLTEMRLSLAGLDLTRFVVPNLWTWLGDRVVVGDAPEIDDTSTEDYGWRFEGNVLSALFDTYRIFVSHDGRTLRNKLETKGAARWEDLKPRLIDFELRAVELQGAARSQRYEAETSDQTTNDVETAIRTYRDSFMIPRVELAGAAVGEAPAGKIKLNFPERITRAEGDVSVGELVAASLALFAYRRPVRSETLSVYLLGETAGGTDS